MKQLVKSLLTLIISMLLLACTYPSSSRYPTGIDDMHAALRSGVIADKNIYAKSRCTPPTPALVKNALMPSLALNSLPGSNAPIEHRFDIAAKDVPARAFFMGLVQGTNFNMVVSPDVQGTISLNLKNVTIEEALEAAQDTYGYQYHHTPYGFEILPLALQTQIFTVNYLDVQRSGRSATQLNSDQISDKIGTTTAGNAAATSTSSLPAIGNNPYVGATTGMAQSGSEVDTKSDINFWRNLEATLKTIIGDKDGRSVMVNSNSGVVIVRAYPNELREVASYLDRTQNNMERQVIIEAKILEVQLNDKFQSGIDWKFLGFRQLGNLDELGNPSTLLPVGFAPMTRVDITGDHGDFRTVIKLLENQGTIEVLSSPRISTVNNQQAVIKVGSDQFFVTSVTTNIVPTGTSTTNSQSIGLTPFFAGITLTVTPQISKDGEIILHIHPTVSTVQDQNKKIDLGNQGGGTTNTVLNLPLAESTIRESDSIVRAQNGQVIVIGGLMQNNVTENINATPGINRIPYLGALFRNTDQLSSKSELVILLKPVVQTDRNVAGQLKTADAKYNQWDRGYHFGSRPEVFGTMAEKFSN